MAFLPKRIRSNSKSLRRSKSFRLSVETLEDRSLPSATVVPNEVLVQFQPGASERDRVVARGAAHAMLVEAIQTPAMAASGAGVLERLSIPDIAAPQAMLALRQNPNVKFVEPNWVYRHEAVSNDPYYTTSSLLWGMYSDDSPTVVGPSGTTNAYGSQAEEAWNAGYTGSSSVVVGIIDEGFQYNHPDLAANAWTNPYDPVDGIDNDGNGYVDDVHGWDFYNNDNSTYDGTADDHGTHVAGTIGAQGGNGSGVAGVNWSTTLISTKFLGDAGGYTSGAIKALDYLTDLKVRHGINVVATNNSWGGGGFSQSLLDAITRAANQGILFVAAAGNGGSDGVGDNNNTTANYPSNYNTTSGAGYDSVVAVAAIASNGSLASFSNYGSTTVDIGAPGVGIYSTVPTDSYASYSGTSMATPHVTGAAALYASKFPNATAKQIRDALLNSATPTSSLAGLTVTGGRLNVSGALQVLTLPSLKIGDVTVVEGNSGAANATFTVSLSAPFDQPVSVTFATANGSATAGSDYTAASGSLTFNPGETSKTIDVAVLGDLTPEQNETFFVNLSGATNALIADGQGQGTIQNDDSGSISIADASIVEGNQGKKTLKFTISLSTVTTQSVSVSYATANGTANSIDYKVVSGVATIAAGSSSTTISVTINGDKTIEPNETFFVNLSNPTNAVLADGQAVGTIVNDDGGTAAGMSQLQIVSGIGDTVMVQPFSSSEVDIVIAKVRTLQMDDGPKNALLRQLGAANESLTKGNSKAAANQLNASIETLTALKKSRLLDAATADELVADIRDLLDVL